MASQHSIKILETYERSEYGSSFDQTFRKSLDDKEGRLGKTGRPPEFSSRIDQLTSVKEKEKQSIVPYLLLAAVIMMLFELLYIKRRGDV